eukprot:646566-Prymnesium_polylepis.1
MTRCVHVKICDKGHTRNLCERELDTGRTSRQTRVFTRAGAAHGQRRSVNDILVHLAWRFILLTGARAAIDSVADRRSLDAGAGRGNALRYGSEASSDRCRIRVLDVVRLRCGAEARAGA